MAELTVATWNMDNWKQTAENRQQAWAWLENSLAPDVVLLQETIPPAPHDQVVWREEGIDEDRPWASAVASFGPEIEEIRRARGRHHETDRNLHQTKPGTMAIARFQAPDEAPVTVASIYGLLDGGYATTTVHRLLTDLKPLLDSSETDRIIVGGDLNCSTQWGPPYRAVHRNLFDRFEVNGLLNLTQRTSGNREGPQGCPCAQAPDCGHVQTHRHNRSSKPWQIDYLFATEALVDNLVSVDVIQDGDPDPWSFSDHCPIAATFDL